MHNFTMSSHLETVFPKVLKAARKRAGYTQEQMLGELKKAGISISKRAYTGYESGDNIPKFNVAMALVGILDMWNDLMLQGLEQEQQAGQSGERDAQIVNELRVSLDFDPGEKEKKKFVEVQNENGTPRHYARILIQKFSLEEGRKMEESGEW